MSANTTIAGSVVPGGTYQDISYVPSCSDAVSFSGYSLSAAAAFDPRKWSYYKAQWHLALAGWICTAIALAIAAAFLIWLVCFCCCACCCGWSRQRRSKLSAPADADYKVTPGSVPFGGPPPPVRRSRRSRACGVLPILAILLLVVMMALAAWAIYEGIHGTHHEVTDFWLTVQQVRNKVATLDNAVLSFFSGLAGVQQAVAALGSGLQGANLAALNLPSSLNIPTDIATRLTDAAATLDGIIDQGNTANADIKKYGVTSLDNFRDKYRPPSINVQNVIIPAILGVLFGMLVLLGVLATLLVACRHLRSGGFFLLLFWIWIPVVFFFGAGLMHPAEKVAGDACLYAENFIYKVVNTTGSLDDSRKSMIDAGLNYYFGGDGNETAQDVATQVYGVNLTAITALAAIPEVNQTLAFFGTTAGTQIINGLATAGGAVGLNSTGQSYVAAAPAKLNQTYLAFNTVLADIQRSNFAPQYGQVKDLLCCGLSNAARRAWISWTAAGTAAAVLGLVLLLRVLCAARDYGRPAPVVQQQFVLPERRATPFSAPPVVPVQANTREPAHLGTGVAPTTSYNAMADRIRRTYSGCATGGHNSLV